MARKPIKPPAGRPREHGTDKDPAMRGQVNLLSSQWRWLRKQPGGISGTVRGLIDAAKGNGA